MKYLVYLYKNYSDGSTIKYDKLEEVVENWGKEKVRKDANNKKYRTRYGTIANNLTSLYNSNPDLRPIQNFLETNEKGPGCYYLKNDTVHIELGKFYIPDAV